MAELARTTRVLQRGVDEGEHRGAQLYVSLGGRVVADEAFGESRPGAAMTRHSVMLWLSAGKPIVAIAIARLVERGDVALGAPVAEYVQEFEENGKHAVTVEHVLTHTGGFRHIIGIDHVGYREAIGRICQMPLEKNWTPGERAGYHPYTGWYLLAELVRRVDGRPIDQFVAEEVFEPLGMADCWLGIPHSEQEMLGEQLSIVEDTTRDTHERTLSRPDHVAGLHPASNFRGPVNQLGLFYEALLDGGRDALAPDTVAMFTEARRVGMADASFNATVDWALGFMVQSVRYQPEYEYDFGPHASGRAFGHGGNQCSNAFADPAHGLVVAWACNGQPGPAAHRARNRAVNAGVYEDLKLV